MLQVLQGALVTGVVGDAQQKPVVRLDDSPQRLGLPKILELGGDVGDAELDEAQQVLEATGAVWTPDSGIPQADIVFLVGIVLAKRGALDEALVRMDEALALDKSHGPAAAIRDQLRWALTGEPAPPPAPPPRSKLSPEERAVRRAARRAARAPGANSDFRRNLDGLVASIRHDMAEAQRIAAVVQAAADELRASGAGTGDGTE